MAESFRVNLYRDSLPVEKEKNASDDSVKFGESSVKSSVKYVGVNETCGMILKLIDDNNRISATAIAKELELSVRAIEKNIKDFRDNRQGANHIFALFSYNSRGKTKWNLTYYSRFNTFSRRFITSIVRFFV